MKPNQDRSALTRMISTFCLSTLCLAVLSCSSEVALNARFVLGIDESNSTGGVRAASVPSPSISLDTVPSNSSSGANAPQDAPSISAGGGSGGGGSGGGFTAPANVARLSVKTNVGFSLRSLVDPQATGSVPIGAISGIAVTDEGGILVADSVNNRILSVAPQSTSIVAGDVTGLSGLYGDNVLATGSRMKEPGGLIVEPSSGAVIYADTGNGRIRYFHLGGRVYTLAGGGTSTTDNAPSFFARLDRPTSLATGGDGLLYFVEQGSGKIRQVTAGKTVKTVAVINQAPITALATSYVDDRLWVGAGQAVLLYHTSAPSPWSALPPIIDRPGCQVTGLAFDQDHSLYVTFSKPGTAGNSSTARIERFYLETTGGLSLTKPSEVIAGVTAAATPADFLAPAFVADARSQPLGGSGSGVLAVDLRQVADPSHLAGALLFGSCVDDGLNSKWAQPLLMEPMQ